MQLVQKKQEHWHSQVNTNWKYRYGNQVHKKYELFESVIINALNLASQDKLALFTLCKHQER